MLLEGMVLFLNISLMYLHEKIDLHFKKKEFRYLLMGKCMVFILHGMEPGEKKTDNVQNEALTKVVAVYSST